MKTLYFWWWWRQMASTLSCIHDTVVLIPPWALAMEPLPSFSVSGGCSVTWAAVFCRNLLLRHLEEFITIGVINDTVPPARSRVISKWRSALTGERRTWENKAGERRWSLEMLKFECVEPRARQQHSRVPQCTGLGVCWEGQETDYPSCFLWLVQMWWMAGRWAEETWHEGRSWQRPLYRGCQNQSCRSRLTLLCAKGTREKASAANPGGCL